MISKEAKRIYDKGYRLRNREKKLAYDKAYYHAHAKENKANALKWGREHPEKRREICQRYARNHPDRVCLTHIRKNYGKDVDFVSMLKKQHGLCGICGNGPAIGKRLDVDHNHETGKVRGLLCNKCNVILANLERGIARFAKPEDRAKFSEGARKYLEAAGEKLQFPERPDHIRRSPERPDCEVLR